MKGRRPLNRKPTPRRPQSPIVPPQANIFRGALIIFCADLDDLCDRCSDQPIVRAAIFLHFCYWFRARGHYLRKTTSILEKRLKRLTSTIKSARLNDAPHQAHAQPDASASFFGERVDGFGQLIDKLTDWEPYARPLIVAASPLLDAWARPQAGHAP
jgi:hypothetical protein